MNLKKDFDKLYNKYNTILSLNELYYFNNQLNKIGYSIFAERVDNKIIINYNKPNIIDFFKRLKSKPKLANKEDESLLLIIKFSIEISCSIPNNSNALLATANFPLIF